MGVLFSFPLSICSSSISAHTDTQVTLKHGPAIQFCCTARFIPCLPFHLLIIPLSTQFSFFYSPHSYLIFYRCLGLLQSLLLFPPLQASFVASSPSSLLPLCLRWRGFCHVFPLIDRWDVWAGYTVALLGSNCSHSLSPSLPLAFSLSPAHSVTPSLPCILSSVSHHTFLHISPCLCCSHWCKLVNAR